MVRNMLLCGTGLGALLFVSPAVAQETPAGAQQAQTADTQGLEEIVVTAQKREQNLQNVPVSVTALSAEAITNQRLTDFTNLTRAVPSLTITETNTAPNNSINLRGIGTFAFSAGVEPSVAVLIDDMPVVQQAQAFDNLTDLQRIEVLKGPQGTLFGKNASAGVINIVTQDPDTSFGGRISASVATDSDVRTEGTLSLPVTDGIGVRVTGFYHDFPGNVRNLTTGQDINDLENYGVRAKLKAELSSAITFTLAGAYAKATQTGTTTTFRSVEGTGTPRLLGVFPFAAVAAGITPGEGNYRTRVDALGATSNKTQSVSGRLNFDLGFANLISITSYQDWKYTFQNDVDGTDINLLGALTGGAVNGGVTSSGPYHSTNFTQELRLASSGTHALNYVLGAFYSDAITRRSFVRGPLVSVANWQARNSSESYALFAQLDYTLPTETTITGGVRYNHEKIGVAFDNLIAGATANTCAPNNPACRGANVDDVVTWKAAISQQLAPQILLYGSAASGYKGYAYDIVTGFNPARINGALSGTGPGLVGVGPIKPERSTSYEIGLKSRFFDNAVQLNIAAFHSDYRNFQAQSVILVGNPPVNQFVLNNVGKLRTQGIEVDLSAKPTNWLRIDAGATYTDAKMRSFTGAQGYPGQTGQTYNTATGLSSLVGNCTAAPAATVATPRTNCILQDRSGARLPNAPRLKWNVATTADFPLPGSARGTFFASYVHQSAVNFDLLGGPYTVQRAYGVFNTSLGVDLGSVAVSAFVNNVFDKHYATALGDVFGSFGGSASNDTHPIVQYQPRDSQRYLGVKATVSF